MNIARNYPKLWIFDFDPMLNAKYQPDRFLHTSIENMYYMLLYSYVYIKGIKNSRQISRAFNDDNREDTFIKCFYGLNSIFPFNLKKFKRNPWTEWTAKSLYAFNFVLSHFEAFIEESKIRFATSKKPPHIGFEDYLGFFKANPPKLYLRPLKFDELKWFKFKFRKHDIIKTMRSFYMRFVINPHNDYKRTNIPDWVMEAFGSKN